MIAIKMVSAIQALDFVIAMINTKDLTVQVTLNYNYNLSFSNLLTEILNF